MALFSAAALYSWTAAPGVLWGDSGECQVHVSLSGWLIAGDIARSHVAYYAVARTVHQLLGVSAAWAATLVSVAAGAVTVANTAWLLTTFCRTRTAVLCGTLLWMLSHSLWQLSASAEVVTLSTALLSAEMIAVVRWVESGRIAWVAGAALLNGLGVSNHNFALLMWPVYGIVAVAFLPRLQERPLRILFAAGPALLLGLIPVLLLCMDDLRVHQSAAHTLKSFLVGKYGTQVANLSSLPGLVGRSLAIAVLNFPTPLLVFFVPGLLWIQRGVARPIAWVLLCGAVVFATFGCRYAVPDQHTFLVPSFLFLVILIAVGLDRFLPAFGSRAVRVLCVVLSLSGPGVYAGAPWVLRQYAVGIDALPKRNVPYRDRFDWFLRPWRGAYDGAERYAREVLDTLPQDAWLVADGTLCTPLNYLQVTEGLRRDVRLDHVHARQVWFRDPINDEVRERKLAEGLLYAASDDPQYLPKWLHGGGWRFETWGHVFQVRREGVRQP